MVISYKYKIPVFTSINTGSKKTQWFKWESRNNANKIQQAEEKLLRMKDRQRKWYKYL